MARSGGAGSAARATVGAIRKSPATIERHRPVVMDALDRPTRSPREARCVHTRPRAKHCLVLTLRWPAFLAGIQIVTDCFRPFSKPEITREPANRVAVCPTPTCTKQQASAVSAMACTANDRDHATTFIIEMPGRDRRHRTLTLTSESRARGFSTRFLQLNNSAVPTLDTLAATRWNGPHDPSPFALGALKLN